MASSGRDLLPCGEGSGVYMPALLWEEHADGEEFPGLSGRCPWPAATPLPNACPPWSAAAGLRRRGGSENVTHGASWPSWGFV